MNDVTRRRVLFAVALAIQVAVILGLVVTYELTASRGKAVYLEIKPVDPRDPLRGDYMTFSYEISDLDVSLFAPPKGGRPKIPDIGSTIYVPLWNVGRLWEAQPGVTTQMLKPGEQRPGGEIYSPDIVYIKGTIESTTSASVHVKYGIEEYFIGEGKGATYPTTGQPQAAARVIVATDGRPVLQQVFVNGKPWP